VLPAVHRRAYGWPCYIVVSLSTVWEPVWLMCSVSFWQIKSEQEKKAGDIKAKEGELANAKSQLEPLQVPTARLCPCILTISSAC
jgi:hypothetical protein